MKNTLKHKWQIFGNVIFGPGSVIFIVLTTGCLFLSYLAKDNISLSTLLGILGAVAGAIAGSFIRDDFSKLTTENILEKKGRSAARNLRSIGKQIAHVRGWIIEFGKEKASQEQKRTMAEIDRHLSTTEMNIESGFEDWVDIVPELAEAAEVAAEVSKRQEDVIKTYLEEWLKNKKELVVSKDEKRVAELKQRITELDKSIKEIRKGSGAWGPAATSVLTSPIVVSSGLGMSASILGSTMRSCAQCGDLFYDNSTSRDERFCELHRVGGGGGSVAGMHIS